MTEYGCKVRKCPCRMWVNCHNYIDRKKRICRLKRKKYDFHIWYKDNFRNDIKMVDISGNG
jgi:hypothetical protein